MIFTLALDSSPSKRSVDGNGFMRISLTPISKAIVNPYLGREVPGWKEKGLEPEGIYYGLRDPKELENAASTFNGLPLLFEHHYESAENPQKEHRVGSLGTDAVFETPYLLNSLIVTDEEAIKAIEDGTYKELSAAYKYEPDFTTGEYEGISYDFVMRNIEGNHVALVSEGRAGSDVAVADSKPNEIKEFERSQKKMKNKGKIAKDSNIEIENPAEDTAIDLTKSVDELLAELFPGVDGEALENAKALISQLKGTASVAGDSDPAVVAEDDDSLKSLAEALKGFSREDVWNLSDALLNLQTEAKGSEILTKLVTALQGATVDQELEVNGDSDPNDPNAAADEDPEVKPTAGAQDHKFRRPIAMDAAAIEKQVRTKFRSLNNAAQECRSILGNQLDPFAFDSAEDIYGKALQVSGVDPKQYPRSAYRGMVDMLRKQSGQPTVAYDSQPFKTDKDLDSKFQFLGKIQK